MFMSFVVCRNVLAFRKYPIALMHSRSHNLVRSSHSLHSLSSTYFCNETQTQEIKKEKIFWRFSFNNTLGLTIVSQFWFIWYQQMQPANFAIFSPAAGLVVATAIAVAIAVPLTSNKSNKNAETANRILEEVPLIDGWVDRPKRVRPWM